MRTSGGTVEEGRWVFILSLIWSRIQV